MLQKNSNSHLSGKAGLLYSMIIRKGNIIMEIYNYLDQETQDVINYFKNELSTEEQQQYLQEDEEDFIDGLNSHLFNEDSVTVNSSGSYTFNTLQAEKNLVGNWELLRAAVEELSPNFNAVTRGAEACDVLIRLYLLPEAIQKALQKLDV